MSVFAQTDSSPEGQVQSQRQHLLTASQLWRLLEGQLVSMTGHLAPRMLVVLQRAESWEWRHVMCRCPTQHPLCCSQAEPACVGAFELSLHLCQLQGQHDYSKSTLVLSLMRCIAADGEGGAQNAGEHA